MNGKKMMMNIFSPKVLIAILLSHVICLQVIASLDKHLVKKNETLMSISEKIYGSLYCYPHIKAFNLESISDDDKILPGVMLNIPEKSSCVPNHDSSGQVVSLTKRIYTVQLASFDSLGAAQKSLAQLKSKNIKGVIRSAFINNKKWFRLQVGEFIGYSKARLKLEKVQKDYSKGIIMSMTLTKAIKVKKVAVEKIEKVETPTVAVQENIINDGNEISSNTVSQIKQTAKKRFQKIKNQ